MKILEVGDRTSTLIEQLLNIWEATVRVTHLFLSGAEVNQIKSYVPQALKGVKHLIVMETEKSFETYKRTEYDEEENPYSLLYMKLK